MSTSLPFLSKRGQESKSKRDPVAPESSGPTAPYTTTSTDAAVEEGRGSVFSHHGVGATSFVVLENDIPHPFEDLIHAANYVPKIVLAYDSRWNHKSGGGAQAHEDPAVSFLAHKNRADADKGIPIVAVAQPMLSNSFFGFSDDVVGHHVVQQRFNHKGAFVWHSIPLYRNGTFGLPEGEAYRDDAHPAVAFLETTLGLGLKRKDTHG